MRITLQLDELVVAMPGQLLRGVSLTVDAGQVVAAVAPPEAGTALARVVAGLAAPATGRIYVGIGEVTDAPPAERRIGYVPAGGALLPHLTVRENIEYHLHRRATVHELARARVAAVIERLELAPTLDMRPHHLSDAQRLRAAIARAAVRLPEALVVDLPEAMGGAERIGDLTARATPHSAPGMAVLVCSADPAVLAEIASQVPVDGAP